MKSVITASLLSGLGDMYLNIYQVYSLQNELKKIGYEVKVILNLSYGPYKINGQDRNVFKRIFKLHLLDNLEIVTSNFEQIANNLKKDLIEAYRYEHIHTIFVDELIDEFKDIQYIKHSWYYRDDLPKINLLSDEVTEFCEMKSKKIGDGYIGLHYRPFSSDNENNIQSYRKSHLVPFGEFIPFKNLIGWVYRDWLNMPLSDLSRGSKLQQPMTLANQKIALNIFDLNNIIAA